MENGKLFLGFKLQDVKVNCANITYSPCSTNTFVRKAVRPVAENRQTI